MNTRGNSSASMRRSEGTRASKQLPNYSELLGRQQGLLASRETTAGSRDSDGWARKRGKAAVSRTKSKTTNARRGECRDESLHRMQRWRSGRKPHKLRELDCVCIASSACCCILYTPKCDLPRTLLQLLDRVSEDLSRDLYAPLVLSYPIKPRALGRRAGNIGVKWSGRVVRGRPMRAADDSSSPASGNID